MEAVLFLKAYERKSELGGGFRGVVRQQTLALVAEKMTRGDMHYGPFGRAVVVTCSKAPEPKFQHTEKDTPEPTGLAEMLAANADDPDVCDWLKSAKVGDVFGCFTELRRVS